MSYKAINSPHYGGDVRRTERVCPMSKKELALAYAPDLSLQSARNRLHDWLHFNKNLMRELRKANYHDSQRIFTAKQVEIIFEHLGEP